MWRAGVCQGVWFRFGFHNRCGSSVPSLPVGAGASVSCRSGRRIDCLQVPSGAGGTSGPLWRICRWRFDLCAVPSGQNGGPSFACWPHRNFPLDRFDGVRQFLRDEPGPGPIHHPGAAGLFRQLLYHLSGQSSGVSFVWGFHRFSAQSFICGWRRDLAG